MTCLGVDFPIIYNELYESAPVTWIFQLIYDSKVRENLKNTIRIIKQNKSYMYRMTSFNEKYSIKYIKKLSAKSAKSPLFCCEFPAMKKKLKICIEIAKINTQITYLNSNSRIVTTEL